MNIVRCKINTSSLHQKTVNGVFQLDNTPKHMVNLRHVVRLTQKWFKRYKLNSFPWPSQITELKILFKKNCAGGRREESKKKKARSLDNLGRLCKDERSKIPGSLCARLVTCNRRRLSAVLHVKRVAQSVKINFVTCDLVKKYLKISFLSLLNACTEVIGLIFLKQVM